MSSPAPDAPAAAPTDPPDAGDPAADAPVTAAQPTDGSRLPPDNDADDSQEAPESADPAAAEPADTTEERQAPTPPESRS
ncbi:hypothetical protein OG216_36565 [Streptomycetaceae bacterium NBC_01309]